MAKWRSPKRSVTAFSVGLREVEGRAQPVNPRANDGIFDTLRDCPDIGLTIRRPGDPQASEEDVTLLSISRAH